MKRAVPWIRVAGFIVGLVVLVAIFDCTDRICKICAYIFPEFR